MFFSLVFSMCMGASAPVGDTCQEWVIDTHKTMQECTKDMDKRIKAAKLLFKDNPNWVISCERTAVAAK